MGSPSPRGGLDNRPLRLRLGWTEYFHTVATNMNTDARLPDGLTIGQKYQSALDDLTGSRLSNPIAVNLSVVTRDGFIYAAHRSRHVAWNTPTATRPAYQPAVSGDGQAEDVDEAGSYDPFHTAIREAVEEATGLHRPRPEDVTFFGLARTFKMRFPFLFGELRVRLTAAELESQRPTMGWEGKLFGLPFTVAAVTDWVRAATAINWRRRWGRRGDDIIRPGAIAAVRLPGAVAGSGGPVVPSLGIGDRVTGRGRRLASTTGPVALATPRAHDPFLAGDRHADRLSPGGRCAGMVAVGAR